MKTITATEITKEMARILTEEFNAVGVLPRVWKTVSNDPKRETSNVQLGDQCHLIVYTSEAFEGPMFKLNEPPLLNLTTLHYVANLTEAAEMAIANLSNKEPEEEETPATEK